MMKNLFLLGDSIRMGYQAAVKEKLAGKMNVYFPDDNGRFAQYTLRKVGDWAARLELRDVHVVHWNNGLWDVLHLPLGRALSDEEAAGLTAKPGAPGSGHRYEAEPLTPPDMYRYMLKRVHTRLRNLFPAAEIVFATTTPIDEAQIGAFYRSNAEVGQYNQIARDLLQPLGVRINELGDFAAAHCENFHRDWVHYTDAGSDLLAGEIAGFLEKEGLL